MSREKGRQPDHVRVSLLKRLPPTVGRIAAFEKVHRDLAIATEIFEHQGDGGKQGAYRAMGAIFEYFTSLGIPPATLEPVMAITAAMVDAGRGVSSPIFDPTRGPGAPPTSAMQLSLEGQLAVITECCVRHCRAEGMWPYLGPVTSLAAKLVNSSRLQITVTPTEMREIRERVRQCKNPSSPDRIAFDQLTSSSCAQSIPLYYAQVLAGHDWMIVPGNKDSA